VADTTQAKAMRSIQPPEPGEEHADPASAAIVAKLEDEVLVVDERPRYHLSICRSLAGRQTISLSAKEAVELEFTPCELCGPVRVFVNADSATGQAPGNRA
jgi:hypothetical protein